MVAYPPVAALARIRTNPTLRAGHSATLVARSPPGGRSADVNVVERGFGSRGALGVSQACSGGTPC
ncbi:hypothetical protein [Streptomyces bullii]|uniref:Uncharacterized protein n=1 Tax=Streptomyces bullii TaxID=349910 RepID=A0ABW0UYL3_9ACTN